MKKKVTKSSYYGEEATTTSKDFGYIPIPGKGGNTTNFEIPEWMFKRELEEMEGGENNA